MLNSNFPNLKIIPSHKKALEAFVYFFSVMLVTYVLKTIRSALFVNMLGADTLPWATLIGAIITTLGAYGYLHFANYFKIDRLVKLTFLFFIASLFAFWWLMNLNLLWIPFAFFVWGAFFNSVIVTQFWLLINDCYLLSEAKKYFGIIGSGGILGGMCGGYLASYTANVFSTMYLLPISILILSFTLLSSLRLLKQGANFPKIPLHRKYLEKELFDNPKISEHRMTAWQLIKSSKYLMYISILIFLSEFISNITDWQFCKIAEIHSKGNFIELTHFFGVIFGNVNAIALGIQLLLVPLFMRKFGPYKCLYLLPVSLLLAGLGLFVFPSVYAGAFLKTVDGSIRFSVNQVGKEFSFLPIQRFIRYRIKPFIDLLVTGFSRGLSAVVLIVVNFLFVKVVYEMIPSVDVEYLKIRILTIITFTGISIWIIIIGRLNKIHYPVVKGYLSLDDEVNECSIAVNDNSNAVLSITKSLQSETQTNDFVKNMCLQLTSCRISDSHESHLIPLYDSVKTFIDQSFDKIHNYPFGILIFDKSRSELRKKINENIHHCHIILSCLLYKYLRIKYIDELPTNSDDLLYSELIKEFQKRQVALISDLCTMYNHSELATLQNAYIMGSSVIRENALFLFQSQIYVRIAEKVTPILQIEFPIFEHQAKPEISLDTLKKEKLFDQINTATDDKDIWGLYFFTFIKLFLELKRNDQMKYFEIPKKALELIPELTLLSPEYFSMQK